MNRKLATLWILLILFAAGDFASTIYGLENGASEGNPLAQGLIGEVGAVAAIALLKSLAIGVVAVCQHFTPSEYKWVAPAGPVAVWGGATFINLLVIV